jgi:hypothetical protein
VEVEDFSDAWLELERSLMRELVVGRVLTRGVALRECEVTPSRTAVSTLSKRLFEMKSDSDSWIARWAMCCFGKRPVSLLQIFEISPLVMGPSLPWMRKKMYFLNRSALSNSVGLTWSSASSSSSSSDSRGIEVGWVDRG